MTRHETKYWDPQEIADLAEKVYRIRLEDDCPGNVQRMLKADKQKNPDDDGQALRARSSSYRNTVRATLEALELHQPKPKGKTDK